MNESEAKKHAASTRKMQRLRRDGLIAQCPDAAGFIGLIVGLLALAYIAQSAFVGLSGVFDAVAKASVDEPFENGLRTVTDALGGVMADVLIPVAGLVAAATLIVLVTYAGGPLFAIKAVLPDMQRVSPSSGLRRIFGLRSWIDLLQMTVRLILWLGIAATVIAFGLHWLGNIFVCQIGCAADVSYNFATALFTAAAGFLLIASIADMVIQRHVFRHDQRMTETELKRERADQTGLPEIRKERRRIQKGAVSAAGSIGLHRVTLCFFWQHYCVGLHYHPTQSPLPRVAAVAKSEAAQTAMRETLRTAGVPEMEHRRIVQACYGKDLGSPVDEAIFMDLALAMKEMLK